MTKTSGRTTTKTLGKWGEAQALNYLLGKNYEQVATGFYCRYGEIDIIVSDDRFIVFVEVKLRKNRDFGHASEYVSLSKQRKLRITAEAWLATHQTALQPRFDVIEVYAPQGVKTSGAEIIHIENAF